MQGWKTEILVNVSTCETPARKQVRHFLWLPQWILAYVAATTCIGSPVSLKVRTLQSFHQAENRVGVATFQWEALGRFSSLPLQPLKMLFGITWPSGWSKHQPVSGLMISCAKYISQFKATGIMALPSQPQHDCHVFCVHWCHQDGKRHTNTSTNVRNCPPHIKGQRIGRETWISFEEIRDDRGKKEGRWFSWGGKVSEWGLEG